MTKSSRDTVIGAVPHREEIIRELVVLGDPDTVRRVVDTMSVNGWLARGDERFWRWCGWPGCLRSFDVRTGPERIADGHPWVYLRAGAHTLLCPDHQAAGHRQQRFEWEPGDTTIRTSCECGAHSGDLEPTTGERCTQWWREHIEELEATRG